MTQATAEDRRWLDAAVREATPFLGSTAENPTVGAILVDPATRRLLGRAVTAAGGRPHAETQAIEDAGNAARGATLYVTLEPCNHVGQTLPCIDAILTAGVARVVIGVSNPDPRAVGGLERLARAGIDVAVAAHGPSRRLHEGHISRATRSRPFVSAKLAVSVDGKVGLPDRGNISITGEAAQRWTDMQRALSDAVMIGWGAAKADDPKLNVGLAGLEVRSPLRVVVAGLRTYDPKMRLVTAKPDVPTLVIAIPEKKLELPDGIRMLRVKGNKGRPDLALALAALAEEGVQSLLVETGPVLLESLLAAGLVDRFHLLLGETAIGPRGTLQRRRAALRHGWVSLVSR